MPELILHAGMHKTGSTAIQAFAHQNRKALRKQGLVYPDYKPFLRKVYEAHHDIAHTMADSGKRLTTAQVKKLVQRWETEAQRSGSNIFLSSEAIYRHIDQKASGPWLEKRKEYLKRLSELFSGFNVTVVILLRRQDNYIKSMFQEHVMKNSALGSSEFETFRKQFLKNYQSKSILLNLGLFEDFFSQIKVLLYEDMQQDPGLCAHFFAGLGLETQNMTDVGVVRKSLSPGKTILKSFLNKAISSSYENREVLSWLNSPPVEKVLDRFYGHDQYELWESFEARQKFLDLFWEENEQIRSRYFPENDCLFPKLVDNKFARIPPLSERCKAELALLQKAEDSQLLAGLPAVLRKIMFWASGR